MKVSLKLPRNEVSFGSGAFLIRQFGRVGIANMSQGGLSSGSSERRGDKMPGIQSDPVSSWRVQGRPFNGD